MKKISVIALAGALMIPLGMAMAASSATATATPAQFGQNAARQQMTAGEVKKINKDTKKITIRHEQIKNLDMAPMTMIFRASDPALLDRVKVGDLVNFSAEKNGSQLIVTHIELRK